MTHRTSTNHLPHDRIDAQPLSIVGVVVTGQTTVDRLAQQPGQTVLDVASRAKISQHILGHRGQRERFIEFAVRQQTAVTADGWAVEFELD